MINWREVPFVRLIFALITGILLAIYLPKQPSTLLLWTGLLGSGVCVMILNFVKINFKLRWLYGLSLSLFLILLGWQSTLAYNELNDPHHFQYHINKNNVVIGKVTRIQPTSTGKTRVQLSVESIQTDNNNLLTSSGNLLVYLDSTALLQLQYGDHISIYANITRLEPPKNPKAFDFSRYMHFQNVHYQAFVKSGNWQLLEKGKGWAPMLVADRMQKRFIAILRKHLPGEDEFAVASALILGYRDEISEEINTAYRNTGATHVLAVSGMHVGFIYIGISFLLGYIKSKRKSWKIIKVSIELFSIWFFALITGGAASILRAAVMFSFIIFGKLLQREANIYNSLAASAFFLLLINPYYLLDVGFQLSYLALIGIIYFHPKIYKLLYIPNKIFDYLWQLTAMALAAQIVTLPLTLYYFHQFPWYFWLSGLAVVPASVVVLGAGFLLFMLDGIPILGWLIGKVIYWLVWLINGAIFLIEKIPGATTTGIWINFIAVVLLYFIILLAVVALNTRRFRWMLASLSCVAVLSVAHFFTEWRTLQQHQLIIYHVKNHTAIDYFDGKKLIEIRDDALSDKKINFANQNYRWFRRGQETERINLTDSTGTGIFYFGNLKVAIVNTIWQSEKTLVDYVIIRENPDNSLEELLHPFDCQFIIFDTSNSWKQVKAWQETAKTLGLETYNVQEQGAFVLDLPSFTK
ncbi:MAG: ComEC/Rec2 family competence protein [Saprospiraceae bacterium]